MSKSSVRDNAFVNYHITTVEVNASSDVITVNCDVSNVQISNISNTDITGDNECTIPYGSVYFRAIQKGNI